MQNAVDTSESDHGLISLATGRLIFAGKVGKLGSLISAKGHRLKRYNDVIASEDFEKEKSDEYSERE